jgi:hypothetical protein
MKALLLILAGLGFIGLACSYGAQFNIEVGQIRDSRVSQKVGTPEVELKVSGEGVQTVKAHYLNIAKAVDDTGASLTRAQKPKTVTVMDGKTGVRSLIISAQLLGPSRNASILKDFSGVLEFVVPSKDTASVIIVDPLKQDGQAIESEALRDAEANLTVYLKKKYAAMVKAESASRPPTTPEPSKITESSVFPSESVAKNFAALRALGGGLPPEISDQVIAFEMKDPKELIVEITICGADGKPIKPESTSDVWSSGKHMRLYTMGRAISPDLKLHITVATEKTRVRQPFAFHDIALP